MLSVCPDSPNCVSSQSTDKAHFVEPLQYAGTPAEAWKRLVAVLRDMKRTRIVQNTGTYLHAECTTALFRFVDDVECYLDESKKIIHLRSASRVGYSDLGVNRKRIEQIRKRFALLHQNAP